MREKRRQTKMREDQKCEVESGTGEQARIVIRERAVNGEGITIVGAEIVISIMIMINGMIESMREGEIGHTPMIQGATGGHAHGQWNDPGTMIATEKTPFPSAPDIDASPPYPSVVASMPYPAGYTVPKFIRFDERKRNAKEHVIRFVDSLGIDSGDLTLRPFENLNAYVRRFRKLSVDVQEPVTEDRLAKICVGGMQPTFKPHLVTHHFPDFSALYVAAWNLSETMETPSCPPRYQSSSRCRHLSSSHTVYAASRPSNRSCRNLTKCPKYIEPPLLLVTVAEAQAFLDAWVQDGKVVLPEVKKEHS
ncbi:hypothetical protein RHSIM_Rhsim05G0167000 [Rhododendron simsii]|uniref:Uncharacterized protein n=1 Tax=Rhododendron simsii TaxID=118357 RepID=A0A834LPN1_RHOSS|nr:hypothetical protein RHSIM_Rhsim05G0167000 [Rhododendron simsii]